MKPATRQRNRRNRKLALKRRNDPKQAKARQRRMRRARIRRASP
ncbi:MAG: hypothetical protein ACREQX_18440 [Candidatus Binataceae bacterium]